MHYVLKKFNIFVVLEDWIIFPKHKSIFSIVPLKKLKIFQTISLSHECYNIGTISISTKLQIKRIRKQIIRS